MLLRQIAARLRALWNWRRNEAELDEEILFHLSEEEEERIASGTEPGPAHVAALKDFGNVTAIREAVRDAWGWGGAERLLQDLRYALRMMRRGPAFTAVAVLTLALGIGSTTAILSVVNALLMRPLPFADADQLVVLFATTPKQGVYRDTTSFLDFSAWQQSRAFTAAAAYRQDPFILGGNGSPEAVRGLQASHELFQVLGVSPAIGRGFTRQEQQGRAPVALISHGVWQRRYGGDPGIVGRTVLLNEAAHSVIGVLPPGFQFPAFHDTEIVVPVEERPCRSCGYIRGIGRLKAGAALSTAQQELDAIALARQKAFPDSNEGRGVSVVSLRDVAIGPVRTPLLLLLGAGAFVLLIGCGNVGNLVLARGLARHRELAVRSALGAGSGRLARQLLTESLSLALVAALLGTVLAVAGSALLVSSLAQRFRLPPLSFDLTMLAFAVLVALLSGFFSGLAPALMVLRSDLSRSLKQDGRQQTAGVTQHRLRDLLVISQIALTVMLLVGAGLLLRSFVRLQQVDVGVNVDQALSADVMLSRRNAEPPRRELVVRQLLDSIGAVPGVRTVAVHVDPPFLGGGSRETFTVEGRPDPRPGHGHAAGFNLVQGPFFEAMGLRLVRGRPFDRRDHATAPLSAVVNETMARRFWPREDAVGKRLRFYYDTDPNRWLTIVGVVGDVRYRGRLSEPIPQVFMPGEQPFYQPLDPMISIVVRTSGDPQSLVHAVEASIRAVDQDQAILSCQPMDLDLRREVAEPRAYTLLLGIFAAIALTIATAGIYAVSAYAVVTRTHEIGIRLAIGATPAQILALVLRSAMAVNLAGVGLGVIGALWLEAAISGYLYGITATDTATFAAVLLLFAVVAFTSTYIPARRAARIDPTVAFRYE